MTHPIIKNWYFVHRTIFDSEVTIHEEIARAKQCTMRLAEQDVRRANGVLQSAIGFEPTDASKLHHDIPPFLPQPKPQVCIDFGFEPTEGCE